MVAIKYFTKSKKFQVYYGVMAEYAKFNSNGTYSGNAGISERSVSRMFDSLEEAEEAKKAFEEYSRKYR